MFVIGDWRMVSLETVPVGELHVYLRAPLAKIVTESFRQIAVLVGIAVIVGLGLVSTCTVVDATQVPSEAVNEYKVEEAGYTVGLAEVEL